MKKILFIYLIFFFNNCFSQDTAKFSVSGYLDIYYSYDFLNTKNEVKLPFTFSHNRNNEIAINNALLSMKYSKGRIKSSLGLHTGTYPYYNYSSEPSLLRMIYEANIGYKIGKDISIDAGVFSSHIGFESALSKDCWTLTRSIAAENSPYFETGAKITKENKKWLFSFLVLNGWQNIMDHNTNKAVGTQIQFRPNDKIIINSSTFMGNELPDSLKTIRYFHDFYIIYNISKKFSWAGLFDIGRQGCACQTWYTSNMQIRYKHNKIGLTYRIEYINDRRSVIIPSNNGKPAKFFAYSLNFDYFTYENVIWRIEARMFNSKNYYFSSDSGFRKTNYSLTTSIAITLE